MSWQNTIEEKFIDTNGITLHTILVGDGEPLLLLHGFPDFWYGWKDLIPLMKDNFKLIIPDLRGYNSSDKPVGVENYRVDLLVKDVMGLIKELGYESVFLAGHDWGGVLSWFIAEKHPEVIKKMAIINGPHLKIFQERLQNDEAQKKASYYMFEFLKPNGEYFLIKDNFKLLRMGLKKDTEKYIESWSRGSVKFGVNYYKANLDYQDWSGMIKVPTLVIHGMKDGVILPGVLEGLNEYVKDLKIIRSEELGHSAQKEDPQMVASTFLNYFK